ncbi:MAG: transcriptional repressor [Propionibacteriaceae bacterium]|jgi:Fur family ferric uptake transcriptional regulator|nr:transcriptional repressor [Propionibacteriaceae bacterium]
MTSIDPTASSTPPRVSERKTRQRERIAHCLDAASGFQTAQQVYDRLRGDGTPVSLPTVYRTLTAMAEGGELDVRADDGHSAYRRCSPDHHHHLVCRHCGRTIEVQAPSLESWATTVGRTYGFTDITHVTEMSGTCPDCQEV